jgi:hypothetical protein
MIKTKDEVKYVSEALETAKKSKLQIIINNNLKETIDIYFLQTVQWSGSVLLTWAGRLVISAGLTNRR